MVTNSAISGERAVKTQSFELFEKALSECICEKAQRFKRNSLPGEKLLL